MSPYALVLSVFVMTLPSSTFEDGLLRGIPQQPIPIKGTPPSPQPQLQPQAQPQQEDEGDCKIEERQVPKAVCKSKLATYQVCADGQEIFVQCAG